MWTTTILDDEVELFNLKLNYCVNDAIDVVVEIKRDSLIELNWMIHYRPLQRVTDKREIDMEEGGVQCKMKNRNRKVISTHHCR